MPRSARLDAPGCLHHVIVRGIERRTIFVDDSDRTDLLNRLAALVDRTHVEVLAWALLDNHFHLLLRSASAPLYDVMRCLNTGYAVRFNRRHKRSGYLFQNRFKSFLVEEDPYLLELVRYIHLNPLRAHALDSLEELDSHPWTGHSALVGRIGRHWQATDSVLALFRQREGEARLAYRQFVAAGIRQGRRPELTGGGLFRSRTHWLRRLGNVRGRDQWAFDERILGSSDFVARILAEQQGLPANVSLPKSPEEIDAILSRLLQQASVRCAAAPAEIASSSRRPGAVRGRALMARWAVLERGIGANAVARFLGVSRQAIRRGLERSGAQVESDCDDVNGSPLREQNGSDRQDSNE
jgi:REP element-mobilizing transposase RayT